MIILTTDNPGRLWQRIRSATRERRIEDLECVGSEHLALMQWPTRHVRLRLHVSVNISNKRLTLLEQCGDMSCSESLQLHQQRLLLNRFEQLFSEDITTASITRMSELFF